MAILLRAGEGAVANGKAPPPTTDYGKFIRVPRKAPKSSKGKPLRDTKGREPQRARVFESVPSKTAVEVKEFKIELKGTESEL